MNYSQINHAKAWGFSRRSPNLNLSHYDGRLTPKALRGLPLKENPTTIKVTSQNYGDVTWLKTNMHISIRQNTSSMSRLLQLGQAFTASITSIITLFGYLNTERKYSQGEWQKC